MAQPTKKGIVTKPIKKKVAKKTFGRIKKKHQEYGTSKLEEKFAKEFLDKMGYKYIYQYKADSIGRYFDFYIRESNAIIEVDGDYYHSYGLVEEEMNPMQKHNKWVDKQKDKPHNYAGNAAVNNIKSAHNKGCIDNKAYHNKPQIDCEKLNFSDACRD